MQISAKFRIALKTSRVRMYRLAQQAGLHPSSLSKFVNGIAPVKVEDPRLLRLGALLGLRPDELFEEPWNEVTSANSQLTPRQE